MRRSSAFYLFPACLDGKGIEPAAQGGKPGQIIPRLLIQRAFTDSSAG